MATSPLSSERALLTNSGSSIGSSIPPSFSAASIPDVLDNIVSPQVSVDDLTPPGPPGKYLNYANFRENFSYDRTTTEQENDKTKKLSHIMHRDVQEGLKMLLEEEPRVVDFFQEFIQIPEDRKEYKHLGTQINSTTQSIIKRLLAGGRLIFVGVGSSGRVGINLAAILRKECPEIKCLAVMGGGNGALIHAREDFEDSVKGGEANAEGLDLCEKDSVILISASGTASFNVGFGNIACNQRAKVFCFFSSTKPSSETGKLLIRSNNPARALFKNIGPQAIVGSTRLQGYSMARLCLSFLLKRLIAKYRQSNPSESTTAPHEEEHPPIPRQLSVSPGSNPSEGISHLLIRRDSFLNELQQKLKIAIRKVDSAIPTLAKIVTDEKDILAQSFFERGVEAAKNPTIGQITWLGTASSFMELAFDCGEGPSTFCLSPQRRECESGKKRSEIQAYMVGTSDNRVPWENLLGAEQTQKSWNEISQFILAADAPGVESYANRPHGRGNMVIAADVLRKGDTISPQLLQKLSEAAKEGAVTALIVISEERQPLAGIEQSLFKHIVVIDELEDDRLGVTFSQTLKWICNLCSNGSMTLLGKVAGNYMVDVRASNCKLISRTLNIVANLWLGFHPGIYLPEEKLYYQLLRVIEEIRIREDQGAVLPSAAKILLTMMQNALMQKKSTFDAAVDDLRQNKENLDAIFSRT